MAVAVHMRRQRRRRAGGSFGRRRRRQQLQRTLDGSCGGGLLATFQPLSPHCTLAAEPLGCLRRQLLYLRLHLRHLVDFLHGWTAVARDVSSAARVGLIWKLKFLSEAFRGFQAFRGAARSCEERPAGTYVKSESASESRQGAQAGSAQGCGNTLAWWRGSASLCTPQWPAACAGRPGSSSFCDRTPLAFSALESHPLAFSALESHPLAFSALESLSPTHTTAQTFNS